MERIIVWRIKEVALDREKTEVYFELSTTNEKKEKDNISAGVFLNDVHAVVVNNSFRK